MSARSLVASAIERAKAHGVEVRRGAVFHWADGALVACNWVGSVLLMLDPAVSQCGLRRWGEVRAHLGVSPAWEYRFHQGFDNHRLLSRAKIDRAGRVVRDRSGLPVMVPDEISRIARDLSIEVGA